MRVQQGPDQASFLAWQAKIGHDRYPHVTIPNDPNRTRYIRIPEQFARHDEAAFIREVYPPAVLASENHLQLADRVLRRSMRLLIA
jgi:hypothetical protein